MSSLRQSMNRIQTVDLEQPELRYANETPPSGHIPDLPDEICEKSVRTAPRKRAAKACLACRGRKVRCDVSLGGTPCMNCRVNGGDCTVIGRPTKYRTSKDKQRDSRRQQFLSRRAVTSSLITSPRPEHGMIHGSCTSRLNNSSLPNAESQPYISSRSLNTSRYAQYIEDEATGGQFANENDTRRQEKARGSSTLEPVRNELIGSRGALREPSSAEKELQVNDISSLFVHSNKQTLGQKENPDTLNGTLLSEIYGIFRPEQPQNTFSGYSQHPLVKPDDFSQNPPQDIEFLKAQGSFQIPVTPALDEFMRQYFSHVHPHLPLIDESAFWDAFVGKTRSHCLNFPISNFTFQAMLFACCSFVPLNVLRDVGFSSIREARTTLYRRAKLLFDFNGKREPISTAQGALLLSYSPDTHNRKVNSFWLSVAIQHAKVANAHVYDSAPALTERERNIRKRLYWCCILRDRILPLGVRRPVFITDAHFDFSSSPLNAKDLENEIGHSKVYDPETKKSLAELIGTLCELAVVLTGVIMVISPVNEIPIALLSEAELSRSWMLIQRARLDLCHWYDNANVKFPTPAGLGDTHESVILYTNLMYLYYYSARMTLNHHELLVSKIGCKTPSRYPVQLYRIKADLQEAATGVTDIMKELLQLRLVKFLPISAVAYIILPLVLNILDVKLSLTKSQCSIRQRRLQIFMEAMKVLQTHYDGTDRVSDAIERIIRYLAVINHIKISDNSAYTDGRDSHVQNSSVSSTGSRSGQAVTEWGDVLIRLPYCYLRVVVTLDLAVSKGEYPEESDFPLCLQTKVLANILPLYRMSQGDQRNGSAVGVQNSVGSWCGSEVRYDQSRNRDSVAAAHESTTAQIAPQSYQRELFNDCPPLEPAQQPQFDEPFSRHNVSDDTPMDAYGSKDFQLDAWMFDVLQDFT